MLTSVRPQSRGGILLAVVGAKLSEGINFSDDLCRCVVVISVPYPSLASLELKERMTYVAELGKARGDKAGDAGKVLCASRHTLYTQGRSRTDTGTDSNLAFRAVNQAIGRAIRHQNDWSAIILLDARYSSPAAQGLLPAWIRARLEVAPAFGGALRSVAGFMKARKAASSNV
jgi:chromosome transmission fidelity protein 1